MHKFRPKVRQDLPFFQPLPSHSPTKTKKKEYLCARIKRHGALKTNREILRLAVPYTGMIISTRESKSVREKALRLGISQISGGSRTSVGGYVEEEDEEEEDEEEGERA